MTKSTITRERLEELAAGQSGFNLRIATHEESQELACMALAAMDSEPVGYFGRFDPDDDDLIDQCSKNVKGAFPLYRHAQPAPEYPETLPCPVFLDPGMRFGKGVKTRLVLEAIQRRAEHYAELEAMTPEERAEYDAGIEAFKAMLPQPAPVMPEEMPCGGAADDYHDGYQDGWNACRAVMLQAQPSDDGEPTDDERLMAIEGINNCERCGDEGWIVGEMGITRCACSQDGTLTSEDAKQFEPVTTANKLGNSPVIPDTWIPVSERMPGSQEWVIVFAKWANQQVLCWDDVQNRWTDFEDQTYYADMFTHWMPLPASPQEVKP
ncbi:TPA: DUF551 domain-containing protein [Klebsiella aerogenes]|nr:DUF551 domain-containing protein [Klebsiella aerogenes]MDS1903080.1 DUF551 domain-containing protein [Klebsiella aerogenes]MDS1931456.1 DUF551 domain-containing protein [Klebsiella aerogenes]MDS2020499.1 DUF551 domain-containing protein [Klebsiella aerogenes]HDS7774031.1 DUF551 domain-containing protein [Klebsiella aerogenes]